jgi:hypothetical protein
LLWITHPGTFLLHLLWFTYRVPDLQLDLLSINVDHSSTKLDADGKVMHRLEALVRELE